MKTFTLTFTTTLFAFASHAQTFDWAGRIGSSTADIPTDITVDASGNVYTTGAFGNNCDFDPGTGTYILPAMGIRDSYVSKLDVNGNFVWAKAFGSTLNEAGNGIALDTAGNVYVTGYFWGTSDFDPGIGTYNMTSAGGGDAYVVKLDAAGNFVWAAQLGGTGHQTGNSIAVDASGNVYTTGTFTAQTDFDPGVGTFNLTPAGPQDGYISILDASGNFVEAKQIGGSGVTLASRKLVLDASGNILITGDFDNTSDFDPGIGSFPITAVGSSDAFVCKLDASGSFIWAGAFGGSSYITSYSVATDASNNIYTHGFFRNTCDFDPGTGINNLTSSSGSNDLFISKLDAAGNHIFTKQMGGVGDQLSNDIFVDASGYIYTTGYYQQTPDFDPSGNIFTLSNNGNSDIYISVLDNNGDFVYAGGMGGTSGDRGAAIAVQGNGIYSTGYFANTSDFDPGTGVYNLTSAGQLEGYVHKLATVCNNPDVPTITGQTPICSGDTSNLSVVGNLNGAAGWYWYTGNCGGTLVGNGNSISVSPTVTTTYYARGEGGCITTPGSCDSITVVVNPSPVGNIVIDSIPSCFGHTNGGATATVSGGTSPYTFVWSTGGTDATVTGLGAGVYTVTIDDANGCGPVIQTITMGQPASLDASVTTQFDTLNCFGDSYADLIAGGTGGTSPYSYEWNTGATSQVIFNLGAGVYTVTVTDANNCTNTASWTFYEPPLLVGNVSLGVDNGGCTGDATATAAGGTQGYSYSWDANANNQTTATATGLCGGDTYCVTIQDSKGCEWDTCITLAPVGVETHLTNASLSVFPNPATDIINVLYDNAINDIHIQLTDLAGKIVYLRKFKAVTVKLDVSYLKSGFYLLTLYNGDTRIVQKISVQRN